MVTASSELRDHLVICGWKPEMNLIASEILKANTHWKDSDMVIIATIADETLRNFKSQPGLENVRIIQEEPFDENSLKKAWIQAAAKVIVLADWFDKDISVTETDARTLMTIMTIEKLAPHVYLIAEILDPTFSIYLRSAHVDEIIYPREYTRFLLANATAEAGIAHVIYDLLNVNTRCLLTTAPVPDDFVGGTFGELFKYYDEGSGIRGICIGLLENTGNIHFLKRRAKVDAQKSMDMRTVLKNLRGVKEIRPNLPLLNPGDDYAIQPYSRAILVVSQAEAEIHAFGAAPQTV